MRPFLHEAFFSSVYMVALCPSPIAKLDIVLAFVVSASAELNITWLADW